VTIRGRFSIFCLALGMILLVIGFQAVHASTITASKIDWQESVNKDEKLHQSTYPTMISVISDRNGGLEVAK